jgi:glycosyltransferase involved in cell wall biosynthesis
MSNSVPKRIRVLYSFPHKLGLARICYTAWQQVNGLAEASADLLVHTAALTRPVPPGVRVETTLSRAGLRLPVRVLGSFCTLALHDHIVARRLRKLADRIDIIHAWPSGALETLKAARELGIPTVLERPNAHTRFAYEAVQKECDRIGVQLPPDHEHAFKPEVLEREEEEFRLATKLLCPSEFTLKTFLDHGFPRQQLARHIYGYDERTYFPDPRATKPDASRSLTMLFVGVCAVRKGLHFALDAWLASPAHRNGQFLIAGDFLPAYREKLASQLAHPSIHVLGHRNDVPSLMRQSDILVLPSIEEGFGLVCTEAMGSGCVPLVSDACTDLCEHMKDSLVHRVGDVAALTQHITQVHEDHDLLWRLREAGLQKAPSITWTAAGRVLSDVYRAVVEEYRESASGPQVPALAAAS